MCLPMSRGVSKTLAIESYVAPFNLPVFKYQSDREYFVFGTKPALLFRLDE